MKNLLQGLSWVFNELVFVKCLAHSEKEAKGRNTPISLPHTDVPLDGSARCAELGGDSSLCPALFLGLRGRRSKGQDIGAVAAAWSVTKDSG